MRLARAASHTNTLAEVLPSPERSSDCTAPDSNLPPKAHYSFLMIATELYKDTEYGTR